MPLFRQRSIHIIGISSAIPKRTVSIDNYADEFGADIVKKSIEMTGIRQLRRTSDKQTASDLGYAAAESLLKKKNMDRQDIGILAFVTHSPDYIKPATAYVLQKRLRLSKECAAYDINLGCSGFVYGLQSAASMLASSDSKYSLLIVSDTPYKTYAPTDRSSIMLFGDAACAVLLEKVDAKHEEINVLLRSDGYNYDAIIVPAGGFRNRYASKDVMECPDGNSRSLYDGCMNGVKVFNFSISDVPVAIKDFWVKTGTTVDDYDCFAFHQPNRFILKQLIKKLRIPPEKMPMCLDRYGNTSGSSIPLTLCDAYGERGGEAISVLACGFGIGLSWGVASFHINADNIYPVIESDSVYAEGVFDSFDELSK